MDHNILDELKFYAASYGWIHPAVTLSIELLKLSNKELLSIQILLIDILDLFIRGIFLKSELL